MSYKIVDQIKKSSLSSTLKPILEAYASFGNRDGTSIRPTEAAVGKRAGKSRGVVSRHTQTLVALGLLVHDKDEHGIYFRHAYDRPGVWAYCYHVDASKLTDPASVEQWETQKNELIEKRRAAGAKNTKTKWVKGTSGNPNGAEQIATREHTKTLQTQQSNLRQTPSQQIATNPAQQIATQTLPFDPRSANPNDNPSARSRAVSQSQRQVSKSVSKDALASLARSTGASESDNLDHDPNHYDKRHGTPPWMEAENILHSLNLPLMAKNTILLLDLVDELEAGGVGIGRKGDWANLFRGVWRWNQLHKKGGLLWFTLDDMAKGLRSASERNALAQWDRHMENGGCKLCVDKTPLTDAEVEAMAKKYPVAKPPVSAPPPVAEPDPDSTEFWAKEWRERTAEPKPANGKPEIVQCPHGFIPPEDCQQCTERMNQCPHGAKREACLPCLGLVEVRCFRKACNKFFHTPKERRRPRFCSPECKELFEAREEELRQKHAKPEPKHQFAVFLNGKET